EPDRARQRHLSLRQGLCGALQLAGPGGIGPGLDFGLALQPSTSGIPPDPAGKVHALKQCATGSAGFSPEAVSARTRALLCAEIFGGFFERANAQLNQQPSQGDAITAPPGGRSEEAEWLPEREPDPQQDFALARRHPVFG